MAKTETTNQIDHFFKITTSHELWCKFDEWLKRQGCQTRAEDFRAAMRIVTNFGNDYQENFAKSAKS